MKTKSPFTEAQLNEIASYQEKRGVTRSAAVKACKKTWASAPATEAPKAEEKVEKTEQRFELGSTTRVKRGFLLLLVEWARKRKTFTVGQATETFDGKQVNNRKVDAARCARYFRYCTGHGIFRLIKNGGAK